MATRDNSKFAAHFLKAIRINRFLIGLTVLIVAQMPASLAIAEESGGIQVHGHWTVSIANPDGTVVREYKFENALTATGEDILVSMLYNSAYGPENTTGDDHYWAINVETTGVDDVKACNDQLGIYFDNNMVNGQVEAQASLTHAPRTGNNPASLTLSRNLALPNSCLTGPSYSITTVASTYRGLTLTYVGEGMLTGDFTKKTLTPAITGILPDQVVTLKVKISFS